MSMTRSEFLAGVEIAQRAADAYYNQTSTRDLMSDEAYDLLVDQLRDAAEANDWTDADALFEQVAAGQAKVGTTEVAHDIPMLSLAKAKTLEAVADFAAELSGAVVLEPKLDGIAIAVEYRDGKLWRASTRGNGQVGEDITAKLLTCTLRDLPRTIDFQLDLEVRGELYVSYADFEHIQSERTRLQEALFANPRNIITGVLRTSNDTSAIPLSFGVYDVYGQSLELLGGETYSKRLAFVEELGFQSAAGLAPMLNDTKRSVESRIAALGTWRKSVRVENGLVKRFTEYAFNDVTIPMPTDGVVIKTDSYAVRTQLGTATRHPRWALAFKYEAESATTKLLDVVREIGKVGRVSYVAHLEPVELDGSTVSRATLNNMDFIRNLGLRLGDTVHIRKANDIIPEIFEVSPVGRGQEPYEAPTTCPYCGRDLDTSTVMWVCENPACRRVSQFVYAFAIKALDAEHWSRGIVRALTVGHGFTQLTDFYRIDEQTLAKTTLSVNKKGTSIPVGTVRAQKLLASLEITKQRGLERVLASLSIPSLGATTSRLLVKHYGDLASIQALTEAELAAIHGLGDIGAKNIYAGLRAKRAMLEEMKALGFVALNATKRAAGDNSNLPLAGKTYVITGTIEGWKREALAEQIEARGGRVSGSISKNTSYLIYGDKAGSKLSKANSLGVQAVPAAQFIAEQGL